MNLGKGRWNSKYICDKCKKEIPFIYKQGIKVHKYAKWTNSCYSKDFDLCASCEKKLREWLNTQEVPTQKELISMFPVYEEV